MRGSWTTPSVRLSAVLSVLCVMTQFAQVVSMANDHGGVPMGLKNVCDDAKTNLAIDWDPNSTEEYTCDGEIIKPTESKTNISCEPLEEGKHVCIPYSIRYTHIPPTSGMHRPNWPDYGEYTYVPPQRWLHNLEHGAIVMLYHPCANLDQVNLLREIVTHCLRKHIITPYKLLPAATPLALLSWGCKMMMSTVNSTEATNFIKNHAKVDGPEGDLATAGRYTEALIVPAQNVSDWDDTYICPPQPRNGQLRAAQGTNVRGQRQGSPILLQSQKRRQQLNEVTEQLDHNIKRLIQTYRKLVSQK